MVIYMKEEIQEFLNKMKDIEYGWIDKDGHKYINHIVKNKFLTDYYLQKPSEVWKNHIGICWDQVEVEREFFTKNNIPFKSILIFYDDGLKFPNHTFVIFKLDNEYGWIENTYKNVKDEIRYYNSLKEALDDVRNEFIRESDLQIIGDKLYYFAYDKPKYGIGYEEFAKHCQMGIKATEDYKNIDTF